MFVLIPAYEPTRRLPDLVAQLRTAAPDVRVLVVDDGSGPAYADRFADVRALGAATLGFEVNRGKGAALKAGFQYVLENHPGHDVVTADSDGQHTVDDILRVAFRLRREGDALVLGVRAFVGDVPARSRFGNAVSAALFRVAAGFPVSDTQTGLRGMPARLLPWLRGIRGDRFEYELEMLLGVRGVGVRVVEEPIATVYLDHNASSHFRPLRDSVRVMRPMLRFAASSFVGFVVDTIVLQAFYWATGSLAFSVLVARVASGSINFALNRRVFGARDVPLARAALRYAALALVLLGANYVWLSALTAAGVPLLLAKIVTEISLYVVSFAVQRSLVFARGRASSRAPSLQDRRPAGRVGRRERVPGAASPHG